MEKHRMKKKKLLLLGASSDIGIETVKFFLNKNWNVTAHYNNNKKNLFKLQKNKNLKIFKFDLSKISLFEKYIIKNNIEFKNYDAFISLTGYMKVKKFSQIKSIDLINHINSNYVANFLIVQKLLEKMKKKKWGRVLLASSIGTKFGGGNLTVPYSISKYLNEFFPSTYRDYYKHNILVNTLQIGVTDTKLHLKNKTKNMKKRIQLIPIKKMASIKEVVKYIYFLSSEENTLITNQVINISGGE